MPTIFMVNQENQLIKNALFILALFFFLQYSITANAGGFNTGEALPTIKCKKELYNLSFSNRASFSFNNSVLTLLNSYILDEYSDRSIKWFLNKWGFTRVKIVRRPTYGMHFYIAMNDEMNLVVFRGTKDVQSTVSDVFYSQESARKLGFPGKIHKGFLQSFSRIRDIFIDSIDELDIWNKPFFHAGHSSGGVYSTLAALLLKERGANITGVYTSAQPRIGDEDFNLYLDTKLKNRYFRILIAQDLTPQVPPTKNASEAFSKIIPDKFPFFQKFLVNYLNSLNYAPHSGEAFVLNRKGNLIRTRQNSEVAREEKFWEKVSSDIIIKDPIEWLKSFKNRHLNVHRPPEYLCRLAESLKNSNQDHQ